MKTEEGINKRKKWILDRLLHHSTVFNINGESCRLREKKTELVKEERKVG